MQKNGGTRGAQLEYLKIHFGKQNKTKQKQKTKQKRNKGSRTVGKFKLSPVLGCTPQAYKAFACPASRPNKEPGVSNRDISGLMDGGTLHV